MGSRYIVYTPAPLPTYRIPKPISCSTSVTSSPCCAYAPTIGRKKTIKKEDPMEAVRKIVARDNVMARDATTTTTTTVTSSS